MCDAFPATLSGGFEREYRRAVEQRVTVDFEVDEAANSVHCRAQVDTTGKTGVEMEALTSVQIGLLTIYDMCKAVDRGMVMTNVRVLEKHGGKSGDWHAEL